LNTANTSNNNNNSNTNLSDGNKRFYYDPNLKTWIIDGKPADTEPEKLSES
jgi:hypothetical protein